MFAFRFAIPAGRWLDRLLLWLSLFGMVLAVHLWIQKARGFDQGCWGLSKHVIAVDGGCREVNDIPASHLFGVSNAAWGYAFYFALALLSFATVIVPPGWARRLHLLATLVVATGFGYSVYLVYQMGAVIHTWCALCLTSAVIISLLCITYFIFWMRGYRALDAMERGGEVAIAGGSLFAAMGLLVGVVVFVDRLGTRPLTEGEAAREVSFVVGNALPEYIDPARLAEMRTCRFDWDAKPLNLSRFITARTPFIGKHDGIPVIVFMDPNCPHCREYLATYLKLIEKYKDRARFTILPRILWKESIPQIEALQLAEGSGKYFDVWQQMLARAKGPSTKMDETEIAALFRELGLDGTRLGERLAARRTAVLAMSERARAAGINGTPTVFIGGRQVWQLNRGEACLGVLLDRMLAGVVQPVPVTP